MRQPHAAQHVGCLSELNIVVTDYFYSVAQGSRKSRNGPSSGVTPDALSALRAASLSSTTRPKWRPSSPNDGERLAGFRKQLADPTQNYPVDGQKWHQLGLPRRSTMICCRNTRISASNAARGRNKSTTIPKIILQNIQHPAEDHPILHLYANWMKFTTGTGETAAAICMHSAAVRHGYAAPAPCWRSRGKPCQRIYRACVCRKPYPR